MTTTELLVADRARELLSYDASTGVLTWRKSLGRVRAGLVAGSMSHQGYVSVQVDKRVYRAHRVAWLMEHGAFPEAEIDHIDGDRSNNRLANLRAVSNVVNQQNQRRSKAHNKCGFLGVSSRRGRWRAQIVVDGKARHLGMFDAPEIAYAAYLEAKRQLHQGCTL